MNNFHITDPTYLRTIHDGLFTGVVHKDNASALPLGLVGMYEEALPPATNVNERKKFLEFFSLWALLKKEVSAEFVLSMLEGWAEGQIIEYIAQYSKWFNSPVSGKYVLYHERLRTFILQKVSDHNFENCNEQIIHQCQLALHAKTGDEWERYALEYLSAHLLIQAMDSQDGEVLKSLSYNTTHWNRQIEISKGFEWSKRMLNEMMLWASKYDDDEVIECALNKVDLHHLEQNDAPRIVELVSQNDIETALQRIESFGGNDKEGLQRKFILYMLCLMELTLLDSKDKPFRKEAIEKLLKHLEDNLPVDHSVLNWNDFFPSYNMFLMICECEQLRVDYLVLIRRTKKIDSDWLIEKNNVVLNNLNTIINIANEIRDKYEMALLLCNIIFCARNRPLFEKLIEITQEKIEQIEARHFRDKLKSKLAEVLILCEKIDLAIRITSNIESYYLYDYYRILSQYYIAHNDISSGLHAFESIDIDTSKIEGKSKSINYLVEKGEITHAEYLMESCISSYLNIEEESRTGVINVFFSALMKCKRFETALEFANDFHFEYEIDIAYGVIVSELSISNEIETAISLVEKIKGHKERSHSFAMISKFYFLNNNPLNSSIYLDLALNEAMSLKPIDRDDWGVEYNPRCEALEDIAIEFLKLDEKYLNIILQKIKDFSSPKAILNKILLHPKINEDMYLQKKCLQELLSFKQVNFLYSIYINSCKQVAIMFVNERKPVQALRVLSFIESKYEFDKVLDELVQLCIKKDDDESAVFLIKQFDSLQRICETLINISGHLYSISKSDKAAFILEIAKEYISKIDFNQNLQEEFLFKLSRGYLLIGMENECLSVIESMSDEFTHKNRAIINVSLFYIKSNRIEGGLKCLLNNGSWLKADKDRAFKEIAIEYSKIDPIYSLELTKLISGKLDKLEAQIEILVELKNKDELLIATKLFKECKESISFIKNERDRSLLTKELALFYAKIGEWEFAIEYCNNISTDYSHTKKESILSIINELFNQNKIDETIHLIGKIDNYIESVYQEDFYKFVCIELVKRNYLKEFFHVASLVTNSISALEAFSTELAKQGKVEEALTIARYISDDSSEFISSARKSSALKEISTALAKQGRVEEARTCARGIINEPIRSYALKDISTELSKQGNWVEAEITGWEISQIDERQECWKEIANDTFNKDGLLISLALSHQFQNTEAKKYFLKGLAETIRLIGSNKELILKSRYYYQDDIESMEKLLQQHALHELFLADASSEKISRFNRTLNIQWAIDLKNSFSAN